AAAKAAEKAEQRGQRVGSVGQEATGAETAPHSERDEPPAELARKEEPQPSCAGDARGPGEELASTQVPEPAETDEQPLWPDDEPTSAQEPEPAEGDEQPLWPDDEPLDWSEEEPEPGTAAVDGLEKKEAPTVAAVPQEADTPPEAVDREVPPDDTADAATAPGPDAGGERADEGASRDGEPEVSGTTELREDAVIPELPEDPGMPVLPEISGTAGLREDAVIPEPLEGSVIPELREDFGIPELPEDMGIPKLQEGSQIPELPEGSGIPELPADAGIPELPEL
ncbi:hypothetical protein ACFL59_09355, partial [Planctomycetota bacterium]